MTIIDFQRLNRSIDLELYLSKKQMSRDLLSVNSDYVYVLTDFKTGIIQAVDYSPNLLNYLRYGIPDSVIKVYPKNVSFEFIPGLIQQKLSFLKELSLIIESKLCNLVKYPPFLPNYVPISKNYETIAQCKKLDISLNDLIKENDLFKDSFSVMSEKFQILFEYWVQKINEIDNKEDIDKVFGFIQSKKFIITLYE